MGQDFFKYLPTELVIDILSRLPVRSAVICKCVDKSWYSLIETPIFVELYRSVPCLAFFQKDETSSKPFKVYGVGDELNLDYSRDISNLLFNFDFPHPVLIHSSANGLLFLVHEDLSPHGLFVCNPVTREYINLPTAQVPRSELQFHLDTYGFGVSRTSGEYKIVRIFYEGYSGGFLWSLRNASHYCQVYTLGTGTWRNIAPTTRLVYGRKSRDTLGVYVNGSLHWLASDLKGSSMQISCVDLEAESFTTFSPPPHLDAYGHVAHYFTTLSSLKDCLCLCDNNSEQEIVIWLTNTCGDEKYWTKQLVIAKPDNGFFGLMWPIKIFQDGDVLITSGGGWPVIFCYSNKTKTIQATVMVGSCSHDNITTAVCYTPSFRPLRSFATENDEMSSKPFKVYGVGDELDLDYFRNVGTYNSTCPAS